MSNYNFSYFNNNDNDGNEMDQLDRMARELNEKKKKFDLIKDVHNDFYDETQKNKKLLDEALKEENFRYFSTQGNINPTTNTTVENNFDNKNNDSFLKSLDNYDKKKKKSNISYDSKSRDDNLSILLDHLKKEHNSHIFSESESIVSDSEESIIKHLKKCSKCKNKIQLVFDDNHNKKKNNNSDQSNSLTIKFSDLKEYLIIILLGFLIIFIIYIFFKFK
jgi:hypothetical protein